MSLTFAARTRGIDPFYVMECAKAAHALERTGAPMIYLNIGEPDFTAPPPVQEAAVRAIHHGHTQYTQATGLPELREAISAWYASRFGVRVPPRRIIITAGASAALQLATLALVEAGSEVLMPDPSYPCNRHFVTAAGGVATLIATDAASRFQLSPAQVAERWGDRTRGILLASPSNPTGTSIQPDALAEMARTAQAQGGWTLVDEIYLGLSYDAAYGQTALALPEAADSLISVNSFSKYFNMTGWRLGWLVVPEAMVGVVEKLAQNLYICPSTISQVAAVACFHADSLAEYERRRAEFKARRDYFLPELQALGFDIPVTPDGAFYAWADVSTLANRLPAATLPDLVQPASQFDDVSWRFAFGLMQHAHLAITPGRDFGSADGGRFVRFSTASSLASLQQAVARLQAVLG
jgi:aspartate/methionine/tyrosine aminotransferase